MKGCLLVIDTNHDDLLRTPCVHLCKTDSILPCHARLLAAASMPPRPAAVVEARESLCGTGDLGAVAPADDQSRSWAPDVPEPRASDLSIPWARRPGARSESRAEEAEDRRPSLREMPAVLCKSQRQPGTEAPEPGGTSSSYGAGQSAWPWVTPMSTYTACSHNSLLGLTNKGPVASAWCRVSVVIRARLRQAPSRRWRGVLGQGPALAQLGCKPPARAAPARQFRIRGSGLRPEGLGRTCCVTAALARSLQHLSLTAEPRV